jgi:uncharacterized protein (TIGR03083 family)
MGFTPDAYLASIEADTSALADTLTDQTLDTDVPSCPGWTMRDLARHLGEVQRWARLAVLHASPPDESLIDAPPAPGPTEAADLRAWLLAGSRALTSAMRDLDPYAPTWHPFTVPQIAAVWPRRQAHEVAVHRWDAEQAVGTTAEPFALGSDFVSEYFEVIVPRVVARDGRVTPVGRLAVRESDTGMVYLVDTTDSAVRFGALDDPTTVDGEIAGSADDLVLALWRRRPLPGGAASALARDWLAFGGN